jgi:hypothetical protein
MLLSLRNVSLTLRTVSFILRNVATHSGLLGVSLWLSYGDMDMDELTGTDAAKVLTPSELTVHP